MRPYGGLIGANPTTASAAISSAAGGVWSLRDAERLKRAGTWPTSPAIPQTISGLQLWLDGSDASTLYDATTGGSLVAADGAVARWEDKSGNARHATQGTANSRPVRKTAQLNNLDGLDFDGTNDSFSVNSVAQFFSGSNKEFTIFGVAKTDVTGSQQDFFSTGNSGNNNQNVRAGWNNGSQKLLVARESDLGLDIVGKIVTGGTNLGTAAKVATWRGGASNGSLFLNGVSDATAADLTGSATINVASVGVLPRLTPAVYFNGLIFEVVIYDSALSDTNRAAVESYLMTKWGIS